MGCAVEHGESLEPTEEDQSALMGATPTVIATQRAVGLVLVGSCSGSLISRDWALTATHCVPSFNPAAVTVRAMRTDGSVETRTVASLHQVGFGDITLVKMAGTASATWPDVTHTMYRNSPDNVSMRCYGYGANQYVSPSGVTGSGWRQMTVTGAVWGEEIIVPATASGTLALAPGDSGGPCFIGDQTAGVAAWAQADCADPARCEQTVTLIRASHWKATNRFANYIDLAPFRTANLAFVPLGTWAGTAGDYTLSNGWENHAFGTNNAGSALGQSIVHLRGGIKTSGTSVIPFRLPASRRPSGSVYIPVTLCDASKGRLLIGSDGYVFVSGENGDTSWLRCFTSLDGASFVLDSLAMNPLSFLHGWRGAAFSTRPPAVTVTNGGVVRFKGAISSGTKDEPFTLTSPFRPNGRTVYLPVDLCDGKKGRLTIDGAGKVTVSPLSDATCFVSLEGVTYTIGDGSALPLEPGWTFPTSGLHTGSPTAKNIDGTVRFTGAMRATADNRTPFRLPENMRPAADVYAPIEICGAQKGRLYIRPDGWVDVQVEPSAPWSAAQCFVSLDGAWFAL